MIMIKMIMLGVRADHKNPKDLKSTKSRLPTKKWEARFYTKAPSWNSQENLKVQSGKKIKPATCQHPTLSSHHNESTTQLKELYPTKDQQHIPTTSSCHPQFHIRNTIALRDLTKTNSTNISPESSRRFSTFSLPVSFFTCACIDGHDFTASAAVGRLGDQENFLSGVRIVKIDV